MERKTPHHVLPTKVQERVTKEKLEEILKNHNLQENVDIVYLLIQKFCILTGEIDIDHFIEKTVQSYDKAQADAKAEEAKKDTKKYDVYSKTS